MTLGQPRQEELLWLLKDMHLSDEQLRELTLDLCPFHKLSSAPWTTFPLCLRGGGA